MTEKYMLYDRRTIEIVRRILMRWGFTSREGLVYAVLLLSKKPLTIEELSKITKLSRSSVSSSLSILTREYMVDERRRGRTKLFYPLPIFYEKFLEQPKELLYKEVEPLLKRLREDLNRVNDKEYENKIKNFIEDLNSLKKLLIKIIEMENKF